MEIEYFIVFNLIDSWFLWFSFSFFFFSHKKFIKAIWRDLSTYLFQFNLLWIHSSFFLAFLSFSHLVSSSEKSKCDTSTKQTRSSKLNFITSCAIQWLSVFTSHVNEWTSFSCWGTFFFLSFLVSSWNSFFCWRCPLHTFLSEYFFHFNAMKLNEWIKEWIAFLMALLFSSYS